MDAEEAERAAASRAAARAFDATVAAETFVALYQVAHLRRLGHELGLRPRTRLWWRAWSWLVLTAIGAAAYGLAVAYDDKSPSLGWSFVDSLKLFPSGFPGYDETRPWQYTLARYMAGSVFVLGSIRLLFALFSDRLSALWAGIRRGHAVVCGLGDAGRRSVRAFRDAGYKVTCLDLDSDGVAAEDARSSGALVLRRDATDLSALQTARVDRAEFVVCSCPGDAVNTKIASLVAAVTQLSKTTRTPSVHVHIDDPELAGLLRGPLASVGSARFHFFNTSAVWARAVLADPAGPFASPGDPPRIAVLGTTALGAALAVGAAHSWHQRVREEGRNGHARVAVVGSDAADLCSGLAERYPAIGRVCELVPITRSLAHGLSADVGELLGDGAGAAAVYCSLDDQSANLAVALDAEHRLEGKATVFLPATAAAAAFAPLLVGAGRIRPVVLPVGSAALELLHDHMREALAREAHERWLDRRKEEPDFGSRPDDRPWDELDESFRAANRRQIDGMVDQLRAVWYELEPRYDWDEPLLELPAPDVEAMARLEHARWCRERREAGWRSGPVRDDSRKIHNVLVPWDELPDTVREANRMIVRARPALLARAGFRLARDPARETLARLLHERYLATARAAGDGGPHAVGWDDLPESARELNRSAVDDFALKLSHIDCRVIRGVLAPHEQFTFRPAEIEELAELEHRRWMAERLADGWRYGEDDPALRTHSSLVPWTELRESEREKDRAVVTAIPALLHAVGYTIVRDEPVERRRKRRSVPRRARTGRR